MGKKAIIYMLVSTLSFAIVNGFIKHLGHLPSFEKVFFRCIISLAITIFLLRKVDVPFFGINKKYLFIRGLVGAIALTLFFIVMERIPLASAVTLQYLSPIFTALIGVFLLKEKVKLPQWIFFAVSFLGVMIMKGFDENVDSLSVVLGLISAALSGVAYSCIRKVRKTDHPLTVVLYFPLVATPILSVFILLFHFGPLEGTIQMKIWEMPSGYDWLFLLLIGGFTQVAQMAMTTALQMENAAQVISMKYLGSILAIIIGYSFFDEHYSMYALLGIAIVLLGVLLNIGYKSQKL